MRKCKIRKLGFKTFCDDKSDFNCIYEYYKPIVTRFLRYRYPKMDSASILEGYDLAMLDIYKKVSQEDGFSDDCTFTKEIERAAFSRLTDIYRKEKKHLTYMVYNDTPWEGSWEGVGKEEMSSSEREMQDGVYDIVLDLESPCDKVISLRYFENVKWKAISEMVCGKQDSKSVHYWHNKCLNMMKAVLLQKCPELSEIYR